MSDGRRRPTYLVNGYGAYWGGIVRVHNEVCAQLARRGDVSIANAPQGQDELDGVTVLTRQTGSRLKSLLRDAAASAAFRSYDVRVDSAPALRLLTRSRRHIVIIHDLNFLRPDVHGISRGQRIYRQLLHRWTLRRVTDIVVNSESTLAELGTFLPSAAQRATVLPLPVDHIHRLSVPRGPAPRGAMRLLTFGHARNKGVDRLLELLAVRPEAQLTVVCQEQQWDELWSDEAHRLGVSQRVVVRSNLTDDDLVAEYLAADVFCMLSSYEGYGLPVAEALSLGTPTVISDLPVLRYAARDLAVVAPNGPLADVAVAVDTAAGLPADHWARAAESFRRWTWSEWVERMLEVAA